MGRTRRKSPTRKTRGAVSSAVQSVASSVVSSVVPSRTPSPGPPVQPFRFFDLPSELRLRIYELLLLMPKPVDLGEPNSGASSKALPPPTSQADLRTREDPENYDRIHPRLALFLVSHRMHEEAYRVFYAQPLCLFPCHAGFYHTKRPLLSRIPPHYRAVVVTVHMRLGTGWTAPPSCQNTGPSLGLADCTSLRALRIYVDCDPSESFFTGFHGKNGTDETYKWFCVDLLQGVIDQVPSLEVIEIDAVNRVKREAPLVMALRRSIEDAGKRLVWGPSIGWEKESDEPGLIGLERAMAGMGIGDGVSRFVAVPA